MGVQEEPDQHERIGQVRVEVRSLASQTLLHLAEMAHVQDQMRAITERLGNAVVKIGEEKGGADPASGTKPDEGNRPDAEGADDSELGR